MALVDVGGPGFLYPGWSTLTPPTPASGIPAFQYATMQAAGHMTAYIGHVWFAGGPGTSKTLSSAGGAIQFKTGTLTWASAGTTIKIGIQDVSAAAGPVSVPDEDWTGEPVVSWVQGTNALTSNTWTTSALTSGSRTLTHGDLIAVVFDMTVRNATDTVLIGGLQQGASMHMPLVSVKNGGTWAGAPIPFLPNVVITCDDGTLCSIANAPPCDTITLRTIGTGSNPDEIGNVVNLPFNCRTTGVGCLVDPDNEFDLTLYSDPLVTAAQEQRVTVDPNQVFVGAGRPISKYIAPETLSKSLPYAVTIRPTGASTVGLYDLAVNNATHLSFWPGGTNIYKCYRQNDTGAFSTDTAARIIIGLLIDKIDDGTTATAGQLKTGEIVNGVTGTYDGSDRWTDPGEPNVRLSTAYKANSTTNNKTGTAAIPTAANVRSGTATDATTGTLAVPTAAQVLSGVSVDATTGTYVTVATTDVRSGTTFGADLALTGTAAIPIAANVRSGTAVDATTGTAAIPIAANVRSGTATDATTGTLSVPAAASVLFGVAVDAGTGTYVAVATGDVEAGVTFGAASVLTGTFDVPTEAQVEDGVTYGDAAEFTGTFVGGATPEEIAEAVWNAELADHTTGGTFGAFVKTLLTVGKFLGLK